MSSPDADKLRAAALALPAEERQRLANDLLESIEDEEELSPDEWEASWGAEIDRRLAELRDGRAELIDSDDVFREARARIASRRK